MTWSLGYRTARSAPAATVQSAQHGRSNALDSVGKASNTIESPKPVKPVPLEHTRTPRQMASNSALIAMITSLAARRQRQARKIARTASASPDGKLMAPSVQNVVSGNTQMPLQAQNVSRAPKAKRLTKFVRMARRSETRSSRQIVRV